MNDDVHDAVLAGTCFTWGLIAIVIASIISTLVYLSIYTDILNLKREAVQHSNAYIQSKVTELVDSYSQYQTLDTKKVEYAGNQELVNSYDAQQRAIVKRMCNAYNLIPSDLQTDEVPSYIREFLSGDCSE